MDKPVPLAGKALRSFDCKLALWAAKMLFQEIRSHPGSAAAKLRAFLAMRRSSRIYMSKLRPVGFGQGVKMGLYLPHWPSQAMEARVRRALDSNGVHHHEQVMLCTTDECPYKCPHCFNYRKGQRPMPIQRLRELVGEIQQVGGSWICIHGGEPLVDLDRTMAAIAAADGRSEVWLATTGFGLDAGTARELKKAGLFGACVSLHHYKPAEHDAFVGYPGAFEIAVEAIEHFKRANVFALLNTTLTQERINHGEISRTMELAKDLGAGMVEILFIRPAGRAVVGCDQLLPKGNEQALLEDAMQTFNQDARYQDYPVLLGPPYFEAPNRFGCVAGNERIFISTAGDLQPCAMVNLSVGNVAGESFSAVMDRLRSLLPRPRRELLCTHLQPVVAQRIESSEGLGLPLDPPLSLDMLRQLPRSASPGAYCR